MPNLIMFLSFNGVGGAIYIRPQDIADVGEDSVTSIHGHVWKVSPDDAQRVRQQTGRAPAQPTLF